MINVFMQILFMFSYKICFWVLGFQSFIFVTFFACMNMVLFFDAFFFCWFFVDSNNTHHPPGHGMYTFEYQLPVNIPSSFEGGIGWVRYLIECVIDRPWKFDHKAKLPFTVNSIFDLNQFPITKVRGRRINQLFWHNQHCFEFWSMSYAILLH